METSLDRSMTESQMRPPPQRLPILFSYFVQKSENRRLIWSGLLEPPCQIVKTFVNSMFDPFLSAYATNQSSACPKPDFANGTQLRLRRGSIETKKLRPSECITRVDMRASFARIARHRDHDEDGDFQASETLQRGKQGLGRFIQPSIESLVT